MKLSSHTIIVEDYPVIGEHLVYSTRTQALVKINQELREVLGRLTPRIPLEEPRYRSDLENLHRMGIIVTDEQEEREKLKSFLQQLKFSYDRSKFVATILTTYGCNLKCVYCFEESTRTTEKLDFATGEQILVWLKRRVEHLGYSGVLLNYYGGEPLLNPGAIEHISGDMKQWCESKGLDFAMTMQTNGYLMTPALVDRLKKLNLIRVRISVDGAKDNHDRNRPLRGGGGTFERITENIRQCVDKVKIGISVGVEGDKTEPLEELLRCFTEWGILHKMGEFVASPIHPTLGPTGHPEAIRGSECMCNHEDKTLASSIRKINSLMKKNGLPYKSGMSTNACTLIRENSGVTIDQKGRIYRCQSLLGHPEFALGDVWHDEFNDTQREFRDLDVWKQCPVDCTYLPMCSGGCRLMSFVGGNKNFKVASCKKPYLNEMASEFIKRDYERLMAEKRSEQKDLKAVGIAGHTC